MRDILSSGRRTTQSSVHATAVMTIRLLPVRLFESSSVREELKFYFFIIFFTSELPTLSAEEPRLPKNRTTINGPTGPPHEIFSQNRRGWFEFFFDPPPADGSCNSDTPPLFSPQLKERQMICPVCALGELKFATFRPNHLNLPVFMLFPRLHTRLETSLSPISRNP